MYIAVLNTHTKMIQKLMSKFKHQACKLKRLETKRRLHYIAPLTWKDIWIAKRRHSKNTRVEVQKSQSTRYFEFKRYTRVTPLFLILIVKIQAIRAYLSVFQFLTTRSCIRNGTHPENGTENHAINTKYRGHSFAFACVYWAAVLTLKSKEFDTRYYIFF